MRMCVYLHPSFSLPLAETGKDTLDGGDGVDVLGGGDGADLFYLCESEAVSDATDIGQADIIFTDC